MIQNLLSPINSPLKRLRLQRLMIDPSKPTVDIVISEDTEICLYPLCGTLDVYHDDQLLARLGGRASVLSPPGCVLRCRGMETVLHVVAIEGSADALILFCANLDKRPTSAVIVQDLPGGGHDVGKDTHRRTVYEYATPPEYALHVGETLNVTGGWSSWPAHADPVTAEQRYSQHEEVFFVITPGRGVMLLDGWYCTGKRAQGVTVIDNNTALVTPLGSHPICFTPDAWGWYGWFYTSAAITKTYNKWAHERGVKTYVQ